jgi:hypothetical protein
VDPNIDAVGSSSSRPASQRVPRLGLTIALAIYGVVSLRSPGAYRLLDSVDLAIHEAGHLVFAPFGEFIGFAGGTLLQLIVPTAFVVYFIRFGDRHAASVVLWWVAQNFWNISVYVRDARTQALPLVGGGEHDWAYLLGRLGLIQHDQGIGRAFHATGVLIFIVSVWWGFVTAGARRRGSADAPTPPSHT